MSSYLKIEIRLTKFQKDTTNPESYKQFYLQPITEYPSSEICIQ